MRIQELLVRNFRGIREARIKFPLDDRPGRTTVLLGVNGSGKTAALDCLAALLSRLHAGIRGGGGEGVGRLYSDLDIRRGAALTDNWVHAQVRDTTAIWPLSRRRIGIRSAVVVLPGMSAEHDLNDLVREIRATATDSPDDPFPVAPPLAVYYPTNRSVLDIPLRIRQRHPFDQLSAYDYALTGASANFRVFFEWFRGREDIENEERVTSADHRDRQLEAVRAAVKAMPIGLSDLRVRRNPLRMVVRKAGEELRVDQLSDGEKCVFALTGDLARRLAIAAGPNNPPLDTPAVVLIDEVDLHLHPTWQRRIVPCLEKAFPKCQFIVSTMSPLVVSQVRPEFVRILRREGAETVVEEPVASYGLDANRALEELMDTDRRAADAIGKRLSHLFALIDAGMTADAKAEADALEDDIGQDRELVRARTLIRAAEILNR